MRERAAAERQLNDGRNDQLVRHVVEAHTVVDVGVVVRRPGNVVVVIEDSRRGGECQIVSRSELADLIVAQAAVGVTEVPAPPAGDSLPRLQHGGVVDRMRTRGCHRHGVEPVLRIGNEQRVQLDHRLRGQRAGAGHSEKRIRHQRGERPPERQILGRQLIQVDGGVEVQVVAARSDVSDAGADVPRQLALVIDRILLDARGGGFGIEEADAAARARRQAERVAGGLQQSARERIVDGRHRNVVVLCQRGGLGIAGRRDRAVVPRRPEHSVAPAHDVPIVNLEHEAGARRGLDGRRIALMRRRAVDAGVDEPPSDLARLWMKRIEAGRDRDVERIDGGPIEADGKLIVALGETALVLETDAVVQRHPAVQPVVVLHVGAVVVDEIVDLRIQRNRPGRGISKQQIGNRVA